METKRNQSEWIINADGSVYHLQLQPHELASTIITVGDPSRVDMVSKYFDHIEFKETKREFVTHTGSIGGQRLTVISSGIGPDNIDIVLNEIDILANFDIENQTRKSTFTPLTFIRLGTSGSIDAQLPTGTVLVSEGAFGLDNLMHFYDWTPEPVEKEMQDALNQQLTLPSGIHPYYAHANLGLLSEFRQFEKGLTLTAPGFYGPQGREAHAPVRISNFLEKMSAFKYQEKHITNIEMESAAIYGLAKLLGHKAISVNVLLANRITGSFSKNPKGDVDRMIQQALQVITSLPQAD